MFGQFFPQVLDAVQQEGFLLFLPYFQTVDMMCNHGNKVLLLKQNT